MDADGVTLIDEMVRPPGVITDYRTQYSGITPELMEGVDRTLEQVWRRRKGR